MFTNKRMLIELVNKAQFYVEKHANEYVTWYVDKYGKEPPDVKRKVKGNTNNFVNLDNNVPNSILANIINTMNDKKVSQVALCRNLNLSQSLFSNWKKAQNSSFVKYLPQIAKYLDVSISSLYGESNEAKV